MTKRYRVKTESVITRYYLVVAKSEDDASALFWESPQERDDREETEETVVEVTEEPDEH